MPDCKRGYFFIPHLLSAYCVPGPILGAWDTTVKKTEKAFHGTLHLSRWRRTTY